MPCLPCFTGLLDAAPPELRQDFHAALAFMDQIPIDDFQAELDQFSANINFIDEQIDKQLAEITVAQDSIAMMEQAVIDQGLDIGTCPQVSVAFAQLNLHASLITKQFKDPFTKRRNLMQNEIARISGIIAQANALKVNAAELLC